MSDTGQRVPSDDSLGLVAALRRAETKAPGIARAMREGRVSSGLFNTPKELPIDWTYVKAAALLMTIQTSNAKTKKDIHRIAAEALPGYTPERAAEIAEACIRWGASLRSDS